MSIHMLCDTVEWDEYEYHITLSHSCNSYSSCFHASETLVFSWLRAYCTYSNMWLSKELNWMSIGSGKTSFYFIVLTLTWKMSLSHFRFKIKKKSTREKKGKKRRTLFLFFKIEEKLWKINVFAVIIVYKTLKFGCF